LTENPKTTLFLKYTTCSQIAQLALADLLSIKRPLVVRFDRKNDIHPFEDASSFEFFSEKNDAALIVFGSHSKKRPHCLTVARCFNHKLLDMMELFIDPETFRTLNQFKNRKCAVGLKPLLSFSGTPFESPNPTPYTLAKSLLLDLFKGSDVKDVDVAGLQYIISISAGDEVEGQPRIEVEEMGPRFDFRIGRTREAEESMMKEALKQPKHLEPKVKKNIETDLIGDKVGRVHMSKQDFGSLQTRKMKGLKRDRDDDMIPDSEILPGGANGFKRAKA
jgi:ribosome production factor 2